MDDNYKGVTSSKTVLQYDEQGVLIEVWPSATIAAQELKLHVSGISDCCTGRGMHKTCGGYIWKNEIDGEL